MVSFQSNCCGQEVNTSAPAPFHHINTLLHCDPTYKPGPLISNESFYIYIVLVPWTWGLFSLWCHSITKHNLILSDTKPIQQVIVLQVHPLPPHRMGGLWSWREGIKRPWLRRKICQTVWMGWRECRIAHHFCSLRDLLQRQVGVRAANWADIGFDAPETDSNAWCEPFHTTRSDYIIRNRF